MADGLRSPRGCQNYVARQLSRLLTNPLDRPYKLVLELYYFLLLRSNYSSIKEIE